MERTWRPFSCCVLSPRHFDSFLKDWRGGEGGKTKRLKYLYDFYGSDIHKEISRSLTLGINQLPQKSKQKKGKRPAVL